MSNRIILALSVTLLMSAGPCRLTESELTQEQVNWYTAKVAQLHEAQERGDAAAETEILALIEPFENKVIMRRADPVTRAIGAVYPPAAPFVPMLPGFLTWLGFPLVGKRGRKHFVRGLRASAGAALAILPGAKTPGSETRKPSATVSKQLLGAAVNAALAYLGPKHSSPRTEATFSEDEAVEAAVAKGAKETAD